MFMLSALINESCHILSTCRQFKSVKTNGYVLFFFQTQHRFLHKKHLLYYMYANFQNYLFKEINVLGRKRNFERQTTNQTNQ